MFRRVIRIDKCYINIPLINGLINGDHFSLRLWNIPNNQLTLKLILTFSQQIYKCVLKCRTNLESPHKFILSVNIYLAIG